MLNVLLFIVSKVASAANRQCMSQIYLSKKLLIAHAHNSYSFACACSYSCKTIVILRDTLREKTFGKLSQNNSEIH